MIFCQDTQEQNEQIERGNDPGKGRGGYILGRRRSKILANIADACKIKEISQ